MVAHAHIVLQQSEKEVKKNLIKMNFLVVFACALAAVSAGYVAPVATLYGAQHFPVINHEGVPVDTADVQYAKATHFAHKVNAYARNGDVAVAAVAPAFAGAYTAPAYAGAYAGPFAAPYYQQAYPTTAVAPASINGVPLETPEVVAAKSNHFAAHHEALARTGYPTAVVYRHRRGIYAPAPVAAYTAPVVASTYGYSAPVVASTYGYSAPVVASTYAHAAPVAHAYAHPYGFARYF